MKKLNFHVDELLGKSLKFSFAILLLVIAFSSFAFLITVFFFYHNR